jgi:hypothetical protein
MVKDSGDAEQFAGLSTPWREQRMSSDPAGQGSPFGVIVAIPGRTRTISRFSVWNARQKSFR